MSKAYKCDMCGKLFESKPNVIYTRGIKQFPVSFNGRRRWFKTWERHELCSHCYSSFFKWTEMRGNTPEEAEAYAAMKERHGVLLSEMDERICRNVGRKGKDIFICSECGAMTFRFVGMPGEPSGRLLDVQMGYCPNCGAKVAQEDDEG